MLQCILDLIFFRFRIKNPSIAQTMSSSFPFVELLFLCPFITENKFKCVQFYFSTEYISFLFFLECETYSENIELHCI